MARKRLAREIIDLGKNVKNVAQKLLVDGESEDDSENDELDESVFGSKSGIELSTSDIVKRAKKLASRSRIQSPTSDITKRAKKNLMANRSALSTMHAPTGTSSSKQESTRTVSVSDCMYYTLTQINFQVSGIRYSYLIWGTFSQRLL